MKKRECADKMIKCCPLCQCDEFLISDNAQTFICGQCGFTTNQLSEVHAQMSPPEIKLGHYIHVARSTLN